MATFSFSKSLTNNQSLRGKLAARKQLFGAYSQYAVAPVHTRFDAVEWFVWDADRLDKHGLPEVIRQAPTLDEAISGLR